MRTLAAAVAAVVALAACGQAEPVGPPSDPESAEMMAEALTHLVTEDHTFGEGLRRSPSI